MTTWGCRVANAAGGGGGGGGGGGLDVRGEILFGGTRAKTSVGEVDQVVPGGRVCRSYIFLSFYFVCQSSM